MQYGSKDSGVYGDMCISFLYLFNCSWRSVPNMQSLLRIYAWFFTPEKQCYRVFSQFATFLALEVWERQKGEFHFKNGNILWHCHPRYTMLDSFCLFGFRNCVTGVYEINLYKMPDAGSPGKIHFYILLSVFPVPTLFHCRYAKEMPASAGKLSGLCTWGGNPGWLEASY